MAAMSHTLVAFAAAIVLLFAIAVMRNERPSTALAAATGCSLGIAAASRPLCALVLGLVVVLPVLVFAPARARILLAPLAVVAATAVPFVVALFLFNRAATGSGFVFPQTTYFDEHLAPANVPYFRYRKGCNALGFGAAHGCDLTAPNAAHTPKNALTNLGDNLLAWFRLVAGPMLVLGPALAIARRAARRAALTLTAVPIMLFVAYSLYWHGGTCFGARFYPAGVPMAALVVALGANVRSRRAAHVLVAGALAWNAFAFTRAYREIGDPQWGYWGIDDRFARTRASWSAGRAVVMVAFDGEDVRNGELGWTTFVPTGGMWMPNIRALAALVENEPFLDDGELVFAKFHPALVQDLERAFPGRTLWLYIASEHRERDVLERWETARERFDLRAFRRPADNFNGFRTAPPIWPQVDFFVPAPDP